MRRITRRSIAAGLLALACVASPVTAQQPTSEGFQLNPGDMLRISVWPNTELGGEFTVEDGGVVNLPYLGPVQVSGMSVSRLRSELNAGYERAMQNPVVSVTPLVRIAVIGEVRGPGVYFAAPTDDVFDVLGMAGGFTPMAKQGSVQLLRETGVMKLDIKKAISEGDPFPIQSLALQSGDNVIVPRSATLGFGDWMSLISVLMSSALVIDRIVNN